MIADCRAWWSCHAELGGLFSSNESEGSIEELAQAYLVGSAVHKNTKRAVAIQAGSDSEYCESADFVDVWRWSGNGTDPTQRHAS